MSPIRLTRRRFAALAALATLGLSSPPAPARSAAADVIADDPAIGRADAPVTIVEFSSYTCPHCAAYHAEVLPWVIATYVDTGRVRYVFHDFPLDGLAMAASMLEHRVPRETARAFSETLYAQQQQWATSADPRKALTMLAELAGLNAAGVDAALADKALFQKILDKRKEAETAFGINATPTLAINGTTIAAMSPREDLTAAIERAEAAAKAGKPRPPRKP